MALSDKPSPCLIVIYGASGDLTKRKLIPALYDLFVEKQLPTGIAVLGISRSEYSDEAFRDHLIEYAKKSSHKFDPELWAQFARRVHYHAADSTRAEDYPGIRERIGQLSLEHNTGENVMYYLSVAPHLYEPIIYQLGEQNMVTEGKRWCSLDRKDPPWQRIIIEKPFGSDLKTARELNAALGRVFEEESIYRIDHYLGKDLVQNLLVFRFANAIFEPIWSRHYIDYVEITAAETMGVEGRGGYYDSPSGGAMRDMIQSHLLQVLALVAMEPPVSMRANDIRMEKNKVISGARVPERHEVPQIAVRGQYTAGHPDGKDADGFREEEGVSPESNTETFAAIQVFLDTWRWEGVPFYLRSGKRMPRKLTEIVVHFKATPHCLFKQTECELTPNQIIINVQPDEGIRLRFGGKVPGQGMRIRPVVMDFDYVEQFKAQPPEAYATLLLDAMRGDQTLYKHRDEIEQSWRLVQPILDYWEQHGQSSIPQYVAGTWGPREADIMLARDGRTWHNPW